MAVDSKNLLPVIKSYDRLNAIPLDSSEVHDSVSDANAYLYSGKAYPGQTIKVKNLDGKYDSYVVGGQVGNLTLDRLSVDVGLVKNYVQQVDQLPEKADAEQGVVYINSSNGKGYTFNGDDYKMIFDNIEVGPALDDLKQEIEDQLGEKISYDEAKQLVASVGHITREIVEVLPPAEEASETVIYMVRKSDADSEGHQVYDEYVFVGGSFEKIGDSSVDISHLATKDEMADTLAEAKRYTKVKADDAVAESKAYTEGYFSSKVDELKATVVGVKEDIVNNYIGDTGTDDAGNIVKVADYVTEQITQALTITEVE